MSESVCSQDNPLLYDDNNSNNSDNKHNLIEVTEG